MDYLPDSPEEFIEESSSLRKLRPWNEEAMLLLECMQRGDMSPFEAEVGTGKAYVASRAYLEGRPHYFERSPAATFRRIEAIGETLYFYNRIAMPSEESVLLVERVSPDDAYNDWHLNCGIDQHLRRRGYMIPWERARILYDTRRTLILTVSGAGFTDGIILARRNEPPVEIFRSSFLWLLNRRDCLEKLYDTGIDLEREDLAEILELEGI